MDKKSYLLAGLLVLLLANVVYAATRPVVANQRSTRQIGISFTDTAGPTNAALTIGVGEVNLTDSATGVYVFSIVKPFIREPIIMCVDATSATTPDAQCNTASVTTSGFRLYCADGDSLSTLVNPGKVDCLVTGWDSSAGAL